MKKLIASFSTLLLLSVSYTICAQEVPSELKPIFPKKGLKAREKLNLSELTSSQKEFLVHGTSKDPDGYLIVEVPLAYIDQLRNLDVHASFNPSSSRKAAAVAERVLLGERKEGPERIAYFFGDRSGTDAMVTIWNYRKDGGATVQFDEFTNQKFDGMEGTLSLAISAETTNCLWKLTVSDDNILFELVLSDSLLNKKPLMKPNEVLQKMKLLINFARKQAS